MSHTHKLASLETLRALRRELKQKLREKELLEHEAETWRLAKRVTEELAALDQRYVRFCKK